MSVGDYFVLQVELRNTGSQAQQTSGYGSLGVSCLSYPYTDVRPAVGQFFPNTVLQPGETHTFTNSFLAEQEMVGSYRCGPGLAYHGYAQGAGPTDFTEPIAVDIVQQSGSTTTSPTTDTTAP